MQDLKLSVNVKLWLQNNCLIISIAKRAVHAKEFCVLCIYVGFLHVHGHENTNRRFLVPHVGRLCCSLLAVRFSPMLAV